MPSVMVVPESSRCYELIKSSWEPPMNILGVCVVVKVSTYSLFLAINGLVADDLLLGDKVVFYRY